MRRGLPNRLGRRAGNAFSQVAQDGLLDFRVKFAQLTPGAVVELNRPGPLRITFEVKPCSNSSKVTVWPDVPAIRACMYPLSRPERQQGFAQ